MVKTLRTLRAGVDFFRDLYFLEVLNVKKRLTNAVKNVELDRIMARQYSTRPTLPSKSSSAISGASGCRIITHGFCVQSAINKMLRDWGSSTDARAPSVLDILASLELR